MMLAELATALASLGYIDLARARTKEALSRTRQLRNAHTFAYVLAQAVWVNLAVGLPEGQHYDEELLAVSTEHGFEFYVGWQRLGEGAF